MNTDFAYVCAIFRILMKGRGQQDRKELERILLILEQKYRAGVQAYHDPPGTDAPITQAEVLAYRRWRSEFQKEEAELADEALRVAEAADTEENEEA